MTSEEKELHIKLSDMQSLNDVLKKCRSELFETVNAINDFMMDDSIKNQMDMIEEMVDTIVMIERIFYKMEVSNDHKEKMALYKMKRALKRFLGGEE